MNKPHILILMHYMELGGVEISLIGLLGALDPSRVNVDLFIYDQRGPLMKFIPDWVNLLPEKPQYSVIERPIKEAIKKKQLGIALGRILAKIQHKLFIKSKSIENSIDDSIFQYVGKCVAPFLPKINPNTEYDLCISFLNPHNIALTKAKAKKKIAWIHTDYSTIFVNSQKELPIWGAYDKIASISPQVTEAFLKTFPSLKSKIIEIENILAPDFVRSRATEFNVSKEMCQDDVEIKFLSVGRFVHQKNFDNVPLIAKKIIQNGVINFKWFIIGYGGEEDVIRRKIVEAGVENHVIILGKKENPYPYIKTCDVYIQPSRYEGKSVTVREAQMLHKPVIVTDYPTAKSQIRDGIDGVIVPLDNEGCAKGIAHFILNKELQNNIISNLYKLDFGNLAEIDKIYHLIEYKQ